MSARPEDRLAKLIELLPPGAQPTSENMLRYYGIRVDLVPGTPVTGLWCDVCLLPSRYEVPLYVLGGDGPRRVAVVNRCDGHRS